MYYGFLLIQKNQRRLKLQSLQFYINSKTINLHHVKSVINFAKMVCRSAVRWPLVSSVPKLAYATAKNTVRNSIDRLVWEQCQSYAVLCRECSTSVWGHHSCHMQVSSVLQQCMVDDLLLVAIDIPHHDSDHRIVLEGGLF